MAVRYLIDGYNVLHHEAFAGLARRHASPSRTLASCIRSYQLTGSLKNAVVVVFDGYPPPDSVTEAEGISFIFSQDVSADERIVELAQGAGAGITVVVSDDRQIVALSRGSRVRTMGVAAFLERAHRLRAGVRERRGENDELGETQKERINREMRLKWLR